MGDATRKRNEGIKLLLRECLLMNLFEVRNIGSRADITGESTTGRKAWNRAIQHPAVLSICPTQPVLHMEVPATFKGGGVNSEALLQVIWMNPFTPAIATFFFHTAAGKRQPSLVEE